MEQNNSTTEKVQVQENTVEQTAIQNNEENKQAPENVNELEEEKLLQQTQDLIKDLKIHNKTQSQKKEYQMQPISEEQFRKMSSEERQLYIKQLELSKKGQFWVTQPVPQYQQNLEIEGGPIDPIKTVKEIRQEPYPTFDQFQFCDVDLTDDNMMQQVYTLLKENYVEDDDNMFRFDYSIDFLRWALSPPGYYKEWIVGVQVKKNKKLCAFITGIPLKLNVENKQIKVAEINFLCVHKNLRAHRLAPVLIKEITRRVNLKNIWQAVYTAGVIIPSPISQAQYFHRSLNPKKLIEANFSSLGINQTKSRLIKLYKLPEKSQIQGIRPMMKKDISKVTKLINDHLKQYQLHCKYTEEEIKYWFTPKKNVMYSYVIEQPDKQILDFFSFYYLPSQILKCPQHDTLRACYSYYNVATTVKLTDLIQEALIIAKQENFDVYNALNIMQNKEFLQDLKFSPGDGNLNYYLYNWRLACKEFRPDQLGMVLV